jgi:alkylation response protein AidB-like acyl-CoA dehydrogenase
MQLEYGPRYEEFRQEVRTFLEKNKGKAPRGPLLGKGREVSAWLDLLIENGYYARTIPKRYGGYGAEPDLLETIVMDEEFNRAGIERGFNAQGPSMLVPTLLEHGSEEQRLRWIAPTLRAEVLWCQGYSEPGAGSDLASLQTSAREDGDDFLISGTKIWTSTAEVADMCFILVRTEPDASKHAGISYILLDMKTPGIEIRPLITMPGKRSYNSFNQVFFTDVRVSKANVVGRRGEGWRIANTTLKHERNTLNSNAGLTLERLRKLMENETTNGVAAMQNPVFRDRYLKLQARVLSMKYHAMRLTTCALREESPGVAGLVVKLQNCQLNFDIASLAIDVMGELGGLFDQSKYERDNGYWQMHQMFSLGLIIGGGTAQIQKNIISERGLGMPREPKPAKA